jgi:arsenite methyltransferase
MAREIAGAVGADGRLYVTEMSADRRAQLEAMARDQGLSQIVVVAALERGTNLPRDCCDAVYMRNVLHHVGDWPGYARDLAATVRPRGVIAVIDFAPGALPHLTDDHGASPERVVEAFTAAGLRLQRRDDAWGGATYLLVFTRVE